VIITNVKIGKKKRLSFFECPSDLSGMMDLAKVADIVLLVIDASFGFEMVIYNILNQFSEIITVYIGNIRISKYFANTRIPKNHWCIESFGQIQNWKADPERQKGI